MSEPEAESDPAAIAAMIEHQQQVIAAATAEEIREREDLEAQRDGIDHQRQVTTWDYLVWLAPWAAAAGLVGFAVAKVTDKRTPTRKEDK